MLKDFNTFRNQLTNLNSLDSAKKQDLQKTKQNNFSVKPNLTFGKNLLCSAEAGHAIKAQNMKKISFKNKKEENNVSPQLQLQMLIKKPECLLPIFDYSLATLNEQLKNAKTEEEKQEIEQLKEIMKTGKESASLINKDDKISKTSFTGVAEKIASERRLKAIAACQAGAIAAAGVAASMAQAPGFDIAAICAVEGTMCWTIAQLYGFEGGKGAFVTAIFPAIAGSVGPQLFSKAFTWIPGAGNALNAAVAYGVATTAGLTTIAMLELAKDRGINITQMTANELKEFAKESKSNIEDLKEYQKYNKDAINRIREKETNSNGYDF